MKHHKNARINQGALKLLILTFLVISYLLQIQSPPSVYSQHFPTRPIVIINPFKPGGGTDIELRNMSPYLKRYLGQPTIIKTIPGAASTIATSYANKAKPNGYTILVFVLPTASLAQELHRTDARVEKFEFIYAWFKGPSDITVDVDSPYKTFKDLLAASKKKRLKAAVAGIGTSAHFNATLLEKYAGIKAVVVPYAGGGPAATALIRGDVDFYCGLSTTSVRFIKAGQARQIAVLGPEPLEVLPDTPTIYELGYKDWPYIPFVRGVAAPPGTSRAIIRVLAGAFKKSADDPGFRAVMKKQGRPVTTMSGEEMKQVVLNCFKLAKQYMPQMKKAAKK